MRSALLWICLSTAMVGQYGTAPAGYYPYNYSGTTFTGIVKTFDSDKNELTLEYSKKDKTEVFVGELQGGSCALPTSNRHPARVEDFPIGTELTAYYSPRTRKVNGEKKKYNEIIGIALLRLEGKEIPESRRIMFPCTGEKKNKR